MAILTGDDNPNTLTGGSQADEISGLGGADTLRGGSAGDSIDGGTGNDAISGESGNDLLFGSDDNDTIDGGSGSDVIQGDDDLGDDDIIFTGGTLTSFTLGDTLTGRSGADTFRFDAQDDDHDLITDFARVSDRLEIFDSGPGEVQQFVITSSPFGPGLLITTDSTDVVADVPDDGLFLDGVTAPLTEGDNLFIV